MKSATKVFIVCSGVGRVQRGHESFAQECFEALATEPSLDLTLFKGGGKSQGKSITLPNFPRDGWVAAQLSRHSKNTNRNSYFFEQTSFFLSLVPQIHLRRPDVIYHIDTTLGTMLWHWRRKTKQSYKLLFCNGAPWYLHPAYNRWDHEQQIAPPHFQKAIEAGIPAEKQSLVTQGVHMPAQIEILAPIERQALRGRLGLPEQSHLILSVGVIDKWPSGDSQKRMDYVIREVARLPEPRPYLLLVGRQESGASQVIDLGNKLLGTDHFQARTVAHHEVADYYNVADAFVLASFIEGLGRVLVEAMSYGVPCLAHDYDVTRYILGENGYLSDLTLSGNLTKLMQRVLLEEGDDESKRRLRHHTVYERFSWERLRPKYVEMIERCATSTM